MSDHAPTAAALHARIQALSISLLQRFQGLLATAHDDAEDGPEGNGTGPLPGSTAPTLSPEEVASKQLDIEVGTTALIRTAEEIMVLTRGMKELWVFGGLDAVGAQEGGVDQAGARELGDEVRRVRAGLEGWLEERLQGVTAGEKEANGGGKNGATAKEGEMSVDG